MRLWQSCDIVRIRGVLVVLCIGAQACSSAQGSDAGPPLAHTKATPAIPPLADASVDPHRLAEEDYARLNARIEAGEVSGEVFESLAKACMALERWPEAKAAIEQAIAHSVCAGCQETRARILAHLDDPGATADAYERAVQEQPDSLPLSLELARRLVDRILPPDRPRTIDSVAARRSVEVLDAIARLPGGDAPAVAQECQALRARAAPYAVERNEGLLKILRGSKGSWTRPSPRRRGRGASPASPR